MKSKSLNFPAIVGAFFVLAILYLGVFKTSENLVLFLNHQAIIFVIGGTVAALLLAYPLGHLSQVFDFVLFGVFRQRKTNYVKLVEEFADIHQAVKNPQSGIEFRTFSHPFLAECVTLLTKKSLNAEEVASLLQDRIDVFSRRYLQDAKILDSTAKYPPLFGLICAIVGLISILNHFNAESGLAILGQALASILVAPFWGIALTSFVFLPLADNAHKAFLADEFCRLFIRNGTMLIKRNADRKYLIEKLASMLPIEERSAARGTSTQFRYKEPINVVEIFANQKNRPVHTEPEPEKPVPYIDNGPADNLAELRNQMNRKSKTKYKS